MGCVMSHTRRTIHRKGGKCKPVSLLSPGPHLTRGIPWGALDDKKSEVICMRQIDSPWLTLPQGARYIQMPPQEFRELVYAGKIPSHKRSEKRIFVHRADLDAMMFGLPSAAVVPEMMRSVASS